MHTYTLIHRTLLNNVRVVSLYVQGVISVSFVNKPKQSQHAQPQMLKKKKFRYTTDTISVSFVKKYKRDPHGQSHLCRYLPRQPSALLP